MPTVSLVAYAKAQRWHVALGLCLTTAATAQLWGSILLFTPLDAPVPLRTITCLVAALASSLPLAVRWPHFDRQLVRQAWVIPTRFPVAYLLFLLTTLAIEIGGHDLDFVYAHLVFVVAAVSACFLADRWWLPTVVAGLALLTLGGYQWYWQLLVRLNYTGAAGAAVVTIALLAWRARSRELAWGR